MPLFMDLHKAADYEVKPTVEEIKRNHIADLEVQQKYSVTFLQYWINEEAGLVFCLMEGPDKESCIAVHQEAHGNMPCNVVEVQGGDYAGFMGAHNKVNKFDIVENIDGTFDTGYRVMLVMDCISLSPADDTLATIGELIEKSGGRVVTKPGRRDVVVFMSATRALDCALNLIQTVKQSGQSIEINIGISAGEPVTTQKEFFGTAIHLANNLCTIARNGQVIVSAFVQQMAGERSFHSYRDNPVLKVLNKEDEQFLNQLMEETSSRVYQPTLAIGELSKNLGMSRSRLYRKIISVTGLSANTFIRETRLRKALQLMKEKFGNVNEVSLEAGFNNTSYFTKSFQKRFGILPVQVLKSGT